MRMRQIGTWTYNDTWGVYLEAVDVPQDGQARYAMMDAWGASFLPEAALARLAQGEATLIPAITPDELAERVDDLSLRHG